MALSVNGVPQDGGGGVSSGDVDTAIAAAITANVLRGAGLPLKLAPTLVTGADGVDQVVALTLPASPVTGRKYRLDGQLFVRDGSALVATMSVRGFVAKRASSSWSLVRRGDGDDPVTDPGWDGFFASVDHLPGPGDDGDALAVFVRPIDGQTVSIEADLLFADLGAD